MDDPADATADVPTKKKKNSIWAPFVARRPGHFAYRNFEWPHLLGHGTETFCLMEM